MAESIAGHHLRRAKQCFGRSPSSYSCSGLLGMVSSYTLGGWIHLLLVLAVIVLIFNLLSGRRAV